MWTWISSVLVFESLLRSWSLLSFFFIPSFIGWCVRNPVRNFCLMLMRMRGLHSQCRKRIILHLLKSLQNTRNRMHMTWSKWTSQLDVAELKRTQWRRSISTRAQEAYAIQLETDCSYHTGQLRGATGWPSGQGMRQLFGSSAVYPSVMASHPFHVRPSYRSGENEGCFRDGARTARRIFFLVREYESESWTNEEPHASLPGRPAGRPEAGVWARRPRCSDDYLAPYWSGAFWPHCHPGLPHRWGTEEFPARARAHSITVTGDKWRRRHPGRRITPIFDGPSVGPLHDR